MLTFVPVGKFIKNWKQIGGTEDDLARLYADIERLGEHGKSLGGNLRIARARIGTRGKRGGVRVAYAYLIEASRVYLFSVYDRTRQGGFLKEELREMNNLADFLKRTSD